MTLDLNAAQLDRAAGVLLGMACGDALGAPYEFGPPLGADVPVVMAGGGSFGWSPGEWTDDTSMAIAIAEVSAEGRDLISPQAQDLVAARWSDWAKNAKDVGHQTRSVLGAARQAAAQRGLARPNAGDLARASQAHHARTGRSGGNGSLMRTAPVALAFLDDEATLVEAAQKLSALTHFILPSSFELTADSALPPSLLALRVCSNGKALLPVLQLPSTLQRLECGRPLAAGLPGAWAGPVGWSGAAGALLAPRPKKRPASPYF